MTTETTNTDAGSSPVQRGVVALDVAAALEEGQQADRDGVMTTVSRQACDEAARMLRQVHGLLWELHPECCGCPVVGAEYMGSQEMICCGEPGMGLLNDAQIVASLRAAFLEAKRHNAAISGGTPSAG